MAAALAAAMVIVSPRAAAHRPAVAPKKASRAVTGGGAHVPGEAALGLTRGESAAIAAYLSEHPELRLATDDDAEGGDDRDDISSLYGIYHPYFVRGDLNDDGFMDFAVAFVQRDSGSPSAWFTIAVFLAAGPGEFGAPTVVERGVTLSAGDLSIDRDSLVVTPDVSRDDARRYRWNGITRRLEIQEDSDGDSDSGEPTSRI